MIDRQTALVAAKHLRELYQSCSTPMEQQGYKKALAAIMKCVDMKQSGMTSCDLWVYVIGDTDGGKETATG